MDLKLHKLLGNLNGEALVCTGVPAHVALLRDIHSLKRDFQASAKEILICQEKLLRENLSKLKNGSQLSTKIIEKNILQMFKRVVKKTSREEEAGKISVKSKKNQLTLFNGRFSRVPLNYRFPDCSPRSMFLLWWFGNEAKGVPPLKLITTKDLNLKSAKKRLSDVRCLNNHLINCLTAKN